ncbi:Acyltransferase, C-terminal domain [Phytophthora cactorum]|nr:Acyltransferase, C-terminal domain [Phytophthora cactorum]
MDVAVVGVAWVLTPCFLLAALPLPAFLQTKRFYRRVTRFMYVGILPRTERTDNGRGWAKWFCFLVRAGGGSTVEVAIANAHMTYAEKLFGIQRNPAGPSAMAVEPPHSHRLDAAVERRVEDADAHQLRIVLKAPLRRIPIFGWAMQHFIFIFLARPSAGYKLRLPSYINDCAYVMQQRRWADDQVNLRKLLPFLTSQNRRLHTFFSPKNGLQPRQYSLYPRTTAHRNIRRHMFYVDYAANERPSEASLLTGRVPRMIHFYIERVDISALRDKSESELATWLEKRFERKESLLKAFYEENGKLPHGAEPLFQQSQGPAMAVLVAFWLASIGTATIVD